MRGGSGLVAPMHPPSPLMVWGGAPSPEALGILAQASSLQQIRSEEQFCYCGL